MSKIHPSHFIRNPGVCYIWRQTLAEVELQIPLPEGCKTRDLFIEMKATSLLVRERASGKVILNGMLHKNVIPDSCTWTIEAEEEGCLLCIYLEKSNQLEWWSTPLKGDPEIDTTSIEPEPSSIGDLDAGTRATVEKMMIEQRNKKRFP